MIKSTCSNSTSPTEFVTNRKSLYNSPKTGRRHTICQNTPPTLSIPPNNGNIGAVKSFSPSPPPLADAIFDPTLTKINKTKLRRCLSAGEECELGIIDNFTVPDTPNGRSTSKSPLRPISPLSARSTPRVIKPRPFSKPKPPSITRRHSIAETPTISLGYDSPTSLHSPSSGNRQESWSSASDGNSLSTASSQRTDDTDAWTPSPTASLCSQRVADGEKSSMYRTSPRRRGRHFNFASQDWNKDYHTLDALKEVSNNVEMQYRTENKSNCRQQTNKTPNLDLIGAPIDDRLPVYSTSPELSQAEDISDWLSKVQQEVNNIQPQHPNPYRTSPTLTIKQKENYVNNKNVPFLQNNQIIDGQFFLENNAVELDHVEDTESMFEFDLWKNAPRLQKLKVPQPEPESSSNEIGTSRIGEHCPNYRNRTASLDRTDQGTMENDISPFYNLAVNESANFCHPMLETPKMEHMQPNDVLLEVLADPLRENKLNFSWKKGDKLCHGPSSTVYLGLNQSSGALIAIKQINIEKFYGNFYKAADALRDANQLQQEITIMKKLKHPHIVQYIGSELEQTQGVLNIFLEYVPGGSLASILNHFGPLKEQVIQRYTSHIMCGMKYLHDRHILHRDIKGANVLITQTGIAKLADFGCSKQSGNMSLNNTTNGLKGTIPWMAPEVVREEGHTKKSDIWSIGCTVIEMLTGHHPYDESQSMMLLIRHIGEMKKPPEFPSRAKHITKEFLSCCLQLKMEDRCGAGELLNHPYLAQRTRSFSSSNQALIGL